MMRKVLALPVAALIAVLTLSAQPSEKPEVATEIESVRLKVQNDGENAYFLFSEAVVLTGTNLRLECDALEVFASREVKESGDFGKFRSIREIIASGNVKVTQQERSATCQKAVVKPDQERIVLTGNPVVEQPGGRIVTFNPEDEIILDRGNGRISINTKGPRKLRLTSSAIGDLGFEHHGDVPKQGEAGEAQEQEGRSKATADDAEEDPPPAVEQVENQAEG